MPKVIKALNKINLKKLSGKLIVCDPVDSSIIWEAYFGNGDLHFASSTSGQKERLMYLISRDLLELEPSEVIIDRSDYHFICDRWQSGRFSIQQARQLVLAITQEAFIHMMAIDNAQMQFVPDARLEQSIVSTSFPKIMMPVEQTIWQWQKIRPQINSPFMRVYLKDIDSLYRLLWPKFRNNKEIEAYQVALTQNLCLYSIATELNIDVLELSYLLLPLIHDRYVHISSYGQPVERPKIAYIDGNRVTQDRVKFILESQGYEVMNLLEPSQAIDWLVRARPTLILLDLSTSDINSSELCQLLRKSPSLKKIPVLILGSHDRLLDRLKAKIVGANEYVNKPITPDNLVGLVNKYVSQALANS
jgi:twitching motility two-component system response regulator PilG